jgi:excisionase family DNA binding protein
MTTRPPEHLVHGIDGPVVVVSARVCAYLNRYAGLNRFRVDHRGDDTEVDAALFAFRIAELRWREAVTGTKMAAKPELSASSQWLSTTQAAGITGTTDRGIRKAIASGHLKAENVAGRWRIDRENLTHYQTARTAA